MDALRPLCPEMPDRKCLGPPAPPPPSRDFFLCRTDAGFSGFTFPFSSLSYVCYVARKCLPAKGTTAHFVEGRCSAVFDFWKRESGREKKTRKHTCNAMPVRQTIVGSGCGWQRCDCRRAQYQEKEPNAGYCRKRCSPCVLPSPVWPGTISSRIYILFRDRTNPITRCIP